MTRGLPAIRKSWPAVLAFGVLALAGARVAGWWNQPPVGTAAASAGEGLRLLSWNVSSDAFVRDPASFRALLTRADADILLFDEVGPATTETQLRAALAGRRREGSNDWHIAVGRSGGRQRGVIVSRQPLERVPELSEVVPYPAAERDRLHNRMVAAMPISLRLQHGWRDSRQRRGRDDWSASPAGRHRRFAVLRRTTRRAGRKTGGVSRPRSSGGASRQVLERTRVDGVIVAGDFNLVSTPLPMVILSGPYPPPHAGLIAADLRHLDGRKRGPGTAAARRFLPVPWTSCSTARTLFNCARVTSSTARILARPELDKLGLQPESAGRLSKHLPLVAEFVWR